MRAPLLQLIDAYPRWLPLSKLRVPKPRKQNAPLLQAMLTGCWSDGVVESRVRSGETAVEAADGATRPGAKTDAHPSQRRRRGV